jgi:hypothetical protein
LSRASQKKNQNFFLLFFFKFQKNIQTSPMIPFEPPYDSASPLKNLNFFLKNGYKTPVQLGGTMVRSVQKNLAPIPVSRWSAVGQQHLAAKMPFVTPCFDVLDSTQPANQKACSPATARNRQRDPPTVHSSAAAL